MTCSYDSDLESVSKPMLKKVPADKSATQIKESFVYIIEPLISDPQPSEAVQPCSRALYYPTIAAQPLAAVTPTSRNPRLYPSAAKLPAQSLRVIRFVGVQFVRPLSWPTSPMSYRLNSIYAAKHHPRVVHVRPAYDCRQWDAFGFDHKMALRARFAAIRRIAAGFSPPFGAGTVNESTDARLQSSLSASDSRSIRVWCNLCHTPACCHSRSLRQQVEPDPQPISFGSQDQGNPVRSTKMMPRSASRLETRGRPPFGLTGSGGRRGSTTAQSSSLTMGLAIMSDSINDQPHPMRF
jgi:hypothetical protein